MAGYKAKRIIDNEPPPRWVVVDETGKVTNKNPSKYELKGLEKEIRGSFDTLLGKRRKYTDKELLDYLIQFYEEHIRAPTAADFDYNLEYPSHDTYGLRFGSWQKALKLVGLDIESMVKKGIIETNGQKARFAEMIIRDQFKTNPVDLAGENHNSPCDGICPNGKIYDVKSSGLHNDAYYQFSTNNIYKEEIEIYYFLAFNEDWNKPKYVWRVPGEIAEKDLFFVGLESSYEFNIDNMKMYEITDKFGEIFKEK